MGRSDALDRLKTFISPYTGVVRRVHENARAPDDAGMALIVCQMANAEPTIGTRLEPSGVGVDYDVDAALSASLGEAVERYSGACLPQSDVILATASEIGPKAVRPERFALHSEDQYAHHGFLFEAFTSDTNVRWVKGWSIPDGEEAYLPLQLAYLAEGYVPGEALIAFGSSNGMALGATTEQAVLAGLSELVERDAVMLTWLNRLVHPRLDWSEDDELVESEMRHFAPTGLRYEVVDLSRFFGIPTAIALILGSGEDPIVWGIGAASRPTMRQACDRALRECFHTRTAIKLDLLEDPERCRLAIEEVENPVDHVYFYARGENHGELDFLVSSEQTRDIREVADLEGDHPAAWTEAIARRLAARDVSAYAVDVTPADVEQAGLRVVHVLSPELQAIDFRYGFRLLGGRRLHEAAYELGLSDRPLSPDDLNPLPHPMP